MENNHYEPKFDLANYHYPTLDLLSAPDSRLDFTAEISEATKQKIDDILAHKEVELEKIKATIGTTLTLYEITPSPGVQVAKIKGLQTDLGLYLAAHVKVIGLISGKGTMGIEIPHE